MRKYMFALLVLSGVAAAQRLRVPLLHRDPADAERAALHEKLTRLAETRKSLGMPDAQSASSRELDALSASTQPRKSPADHRALGGESAGQTQVKTANAWPPPPQTWTSADREPSLGDVARKERARKRQARSKREPSQSPN